MKHYDNPAYGKMMNRGAESKGERDIKEPHKRPAMEHGGESENKITLTKHEDGHYSTHDGKSEPVHHDRFEDAMNHVHGHFGETGMQEQTKDDNTGYSSGDNMEDMDSALGR